MFLLEVQKKIYFTKRVYILSIIHHIHLHNFASCLHQMTFMLVKQNICYIHVYLYNIKILNIVYFMDI